MSANEHNSNGHEQQLKPPRRKTKYLVTLLAVVAVLVCPWPADNNTFIGSDYQQATLSRLQTKEISASEPAILHAGIAEVDITPPAGHPLAGYGSRSPKSYTEIHSRCYARALTLASGEHQVTILTADILTIHPAMAEAVLAKAGLKHEQVYFTASHTHAGPGGYIDRFIEESVLGKYDDGYFEDLTTKLAEVIKQSRQNLVEVEMGLLKANAAGQLKNRIDTNRPTYDKLSALVFREVKGMFGVSLKPLAVLLSFGAHPTIIGRHQYVLSSGYPGVLTEELKRHTGAKMVLFAAGTVGDAKPAIREPAERLQRSAKYGKALANILIEQWDQISYEQKTAMSNVRLALDLPTLRITAGPKWRINPLCTSWLAEKKSHLHIIRIGKVVLAGFPGDYSGELGRALDNWTSARGLELVPTSFNGDWKGYLVLRDSFFKYSGYETRDMNFYGPWSGEYLNDLTKRMIERTGPLE